MNQSKEFSRQILKRSSYLQSSTPTDNDEQQLQETVRCLSKVFENEHFFSFFQVEELQKTVETLNQQKQSTTERLSKIQSENTDLKSRLVSSSAIDCLSIQFFLFLDFYLLKIVFTILKANTHVQYEVINRNTKNTSYV